MAARHIPHMLSSAEVGYWGSNGGSPVQGTDALPTRPPWRTGREEIQFFDNMMYFSNLIHF